MKNGATTPNPQSFDLTITPYEVGTPEYQVRYSKSVVVEGTVTIAAGTTVVIDRSDQGSIVIYPGSKLRVEGVLKLKGTEAAPFILQPASGTWYGIEIIGSQAGGSEIDYCNISGTTSPIKISNASCVIVDHVAVSGGTYGVEASNATNLNLQYVTVTGATYPLKMSNTGGAVLDHVTISGSNWSDAAMQFYGSSPTITNSNITGTGQNYASNGIRFDGSNGSISNSTIQNCGAGNGIVIQNGSNPVISNVTVQNNLYHGIILVDNYIEEQGGGASANPSSEIITSPMEQLPPPPSPGPMVRISGSTIAGNGVVNGVKTYVGVDAYNSWCDLTGNSITGSNYGVYADTYGYITGAQASVNNATNVVSGNNLGLVGFNSGWVVLGHDLDYNDTYGVWLYPGGCNKVINNTYNIVASQWSYVYGNGNWWGEYPPNEAKFIAVNGSGYSWDPAMPNDYDCLMEWGGPTAAPAGEGIVSAEAMTEFDRAVMALRRGNLVMARDLFQYIMDRSNGSSKKAALLGLYRAKKAIDRSSARTFVSSLASQTGEVQSLAEDLLLDAYMTERDFVSMKLLANSIVNRFPRTDRAKLALTMLASLKSYDRAETETSQRALNQLYRSFGGVADKGLLVALGEDPGLLEAPSEMSAGSLEEVQLEVYPNPFNPSTEIRYIVTNPGEVRIEIFDILGRSVELLVNETKAIGQHSATWNGDRFPSGMYLLRYVAGGKAAVKKLMLAK